MTTNEPIITQQIQWMEYGLPKNKISIFKLLFSFTDERKPITKETTVFVTTSEHSSNVTVQSMDSINGRSHWSLSKDELKDFTDPPDNAAGDTARFLFLQDLDMYRERNNRQYNEERERKLRRSERRWGLFLIIATAFVTALATAMLPLLIL